MTQHTHFDVIIVGGSYAGLSAAMALGRALRSVLIIDSGKPCNRQTPYSHNFITGDGATPAALSALARTQVLKYDSVIFQEGLVTQARRTVKGFEIQTRAGAYFSAGKLLFATGVQDIMPSLEGFRECWGISVVHCPYCHGYEIRGARTGILAGGDTAFELAKLISNWTENLTVFSDGASGLSAEQSGKLGARGVRVIEKKLLRIVHDNGRLDQLLFKDGSKEPLTALYARPAFSQHCSIPGVLGCELTEEGYIRVDEFQRTTVPGVYAAGDNTTPMRAVAAAVAAGTKAGAMLNKELIDERF